MKLSAAAVLQKPYNEFFKAAVASAGNHDNNVYNNSWAERYHGMKEVSGKQEDAKKEVTPPTKKGFKGGRAADGPAFSRGSDSDDGDERTGHDEVLNKSPIRQPREQDSPSATSGELEHPAARDEPGIIGIGR